MRFGDGHVVYEPNPQFGREFEQRLGVWLTRVVAPAIIDREEQLAPVETGALRDGFRDRLIRVAGVLALLVYNVEDYADLVERGHGHVEPQPFARPALEEVARL